MLQHFLPILCPFLHNYHRYLAGLPLLFKKDSSVAKVLCKIHSADLILVCDWSIEKPPCIYMVEIHGCKEKSYDSHSLQW